MSKSKIEWCTDTWNPISGCTPISAGCENCYAKNWHVRFRNGDFSVKKAKDKKFIEPLRAKKPKRYFVGSMTDIFHDDVDEKWLDEIFGMILAQYVFNNTENHKFLVLTKRPERMKEYFSKEPKELLKRWANVAPVYTDNENVCFIDLVESACCRDWDENGRNSKNSPIVSWGYCHRLFPLPNLWLGVTAENQEMADQRIPILLDTPAAGKFVSVEPMLSRVNIMKFLNYGLTGIDWVICGGESGKGARPCNKEWVLDLEDQCAPCGIYFFFKQWGEFDESGKRVGKKNAGRLLDGREYMQIPRDLRVEVK